MVPAVVEFCQTAGLADKAVERRVVLTGVAGVRCVGTTSVITRSAIVRSRGYRGSCTDHGGSCDPGLIHSAPRLSTRNAGNAHGRERAADACLRAFDRE